MKKKSLLLLIPFAAAAAVALGSCGKDPAPQCDQASVILDSQAITIEVGATKQLTATSNIDGCTINVNWRSDDASIASIDQNGVVTGHKNGSTMVYANDVPCLVTVGSGHADVHVESMVLVSPSSQSPSMNIGDQLDISVDILPENADNKLVTVTSDNENVAIINESGNIEAVGEGNAVVSVVSQDNPEVKIDIHVSVSIPDAPAPEATANGFALLKSGEVQNGEAVVFSGIDGSKYLTMGTHETGKNNIPAVESSINSDNQLVLNSKAGVYIALKNEDGSFSFKDSNNKYLSAAGGTKSNYLKTVDEIDETAKFNVVVTDGVATIVCTSENIDRNTIALNSANQSGPIFSCYKSSSAAGYAKINLYHGEASTDVTGVAFEHEKYEVMVDYTITAKAVVAPITATDKAITYSLEDLNPAGCATVETVDNEAVVHGIAEGVGKLVATTHEGSFTSKVTLEVKPKGSIVIPVIGIKLAAKSGTVTVGETKQITASVLPEDATSQAISFESLNTDLATVDPDGLVTAIAAGTAKIKVYATDYPEVSETYTLTIKEATVSYPSETNEGRVLIQNGTLTDGASINIVAGNEGALVAAEGALSGTNKYLAVVSCGVESEKLVLGAGAGTFTVVANKDGSYSFKTADGKYLAANPDKNQIIEVPAINQAAKFSVNIVNGAASIICTDPDNLSHNTMLYNTGDPRFACYSSSFSGVAPRIYSMDPEPVDAEGIELDVEEKIIALNEEYQLDATVLPSWAKDKKVTWTTESKGIVSVTNGLVKGLAEGTEVVTATDVMGHTASCSFTVVSEIKHPESITLSEHSLALDVDDIHDTLSATVLPADAYNKNFTWASDNEDVVKVDENGKLECVGAGTANITVITEDGGKTDTCAVSVAAASDGVVHAYEAAMAMEPGTGASERSYTISGRIMFMPGNNLIVQDGDHAIIVYKSGASTKEMEVGKKVTLRCQVQNYYGAAETVQVANSIIAVSDDEVSVNKAVIDTSEKMDTSAMPLYADFKNLVLKTKPNVVKGNNSSITVAFEDDLEKEYTLFVKSDEYNEDMANVLNELNVNSKVEIQGAYISGHSSGRQICAGISSVAIDHSEYVPESVIVKNGEDAITSLNMVTGGNAILTASVLPAKAPQDVVWETKNNNDVISVVNGAVGALKAGTATIVVSSADKTQSTEILVTVADEEVIATSVTLNEETVDLFVGGTKQLSATVLPEGTTDKSIEWSVIKGNDVVSVNNGLVTALAEGEATVQAKNVKSGLTDTCTFTVSKKVIDVDKVDSVTLTAAEDSLNLGQYGSGSNEFYQWTDLAKNNGNIQGNLSTGASAKDSELHNKFEFSRPIKYVKITVGAKSGDTTTLEMRFGDTEKPEGNAIAMGAETKYDLTTVGNSFVLKPDVAAKYFSLKNTKGATYISSIEIGFVDYNVPVEGIDLNKNTVSLAVEETFTIEATLTPSDTTHTTLSYTSDHPEIAEVTTDGIVIAKAAGTATITVKTDDPDIYDTLVVNVVETKTHVTKVELTDHETEILQGGCTTLTATVSPDDATNKNLYWCVEEGKEDIISVDQDGCVTGLQPGTAKVIVKAADNLDIYDECEVTVEERFIDVDDVDEYTIDKTSLGVGSEYADGSNEYFEWTKLTTNGNSVQGSADSKYKSELHNVYAFSKEITYIVVEVDKTAGVNATAEVRFGDSVMPTDNAVAIGKDTSYPLDTAGKFVIMVPDGCDFFSLKPTNNAMYFKSITFGFGEYIEHVTGVSLNKETTTIQEGANEQLTATVSPDNADDKTVTWTSSNDSIATVVDGKVTAVSAGEATITVKTTDGEFEANCVVTVVEKIIDVENITLDKETLTLEEGKDSTLVATVTPDEATHPEHTWYSSDETVAKVDQDGKVTAVAPGEATITVKVDGDESKHAECVVTVTEAPRQDLPYNGSFAFKDGSEVFPEGNWDGTGVAYYGTAYSFQAKDQYVQATKLFDETSAITVDITALVNSESDTSGVLTVYALNDAGEVVTFDEVSPANEKVTSIDAGKTAALNNIISVTLQGEKITGLKIAYTNGSSKMFLFNVKITDIGKVTDVELSEHDLELVVGNTGTLTATVIPDTAVNKEVTFTSDNEDAVTIDASTGAYEAVGVGNATITVTTTDGSYKDTCSVAVSAAERTMTGIIVEGPTKVEYTEGEKLDLTGLVVKAVYDSGDPKVITEGYTTNIALDHPLELTDTSLVVSYNDFDADAITLTINKAPAIIASGNYVIKHTRSDVTYYMSSEVGAKGQPLATTDKSKAAEFDFELKEGTNDTYTIKIHGETKYLALNANDNNGVRYTSSPFEWKIEDGTLASGAYNLSGVYSSTQRFLTFYQNGTDYDFRCYTTADATNRKENSDLEAIVVKDVVSIAIKENPTKMTYYVGDPFDPTGMVVTVTYSDDSTVDITEGFTYEGSTGFTTVNPDRTVKVTYKGKNAYVEHVAVIEDERTLTGIEFAEGSDMTKKEYKEGDTWDSTGITVNDVYSDDSREVAEGVSLSFNPASPAVGTTQVVVTATKEGCDPVSMTVTGISVAELPKNVDEITAAAFGVTSSSYTSFTDKVLVSGAKYSGMVAKNSNGVIQLNNSDKGIYSTDSLRTLKSVSLKFNSNTTDARTISIYAKQGNFASTQDTEGATLVATFKKTSTETSFSYSFEDLSNYTNILIRANNAVYLDELVVTWSEIKYDAFVFGVSLDEAEATVNMGETLTLNATVNGYGENYDQLTWESSDASKVTVVNGVLTPVAVTEEPVTITATSVVDSTKSATCAVSVASARSFTELTTTGGFKTSYKTTDTAFAVNDLKVYANYSDGSDEEVTDYTVTWSNAFNTTAGNYTSVPTIHWNGHDLVLSEVSYTVSAPAAKTSDLVFPSGETVPTGWSTSYAAHTVENDDFAVAFADASYNAPSSGTAWDSKHPTSKTGALTVSLKIDAKITGFSLECLQWGTNAKTISYQYTINGTDWVAGTATSSNFSLKVDSLPDGVVGLKFATTNTSKQIGFVSLSLNLLA